LQSAELCPLVYGPASEFDRTVKLLGVKGGTGGAGQQRRGEPLLGGGGSGGSGSEGSGGEKKVRRAF